MWEFMLTPFLKSVKISNSCCSFKVGFNNAIHDASKLHLNFGGPYIKLPN